MLLQRQENVFNDIKESFGDVKFFKDDAKYLKEKVSEVNQILFDFEQNKLNSFIFYGIPNCTDKTQSTLKGTMTEKTKF